MRENEFQQLMNDFNDEMEAIAGQPDNGEELTYGEMQTAKPSRERKKLEYIDELYNRIDRIRQDSKGMFGEYDRMWLRALQKIIDSEPAIEDTEPHPKQFSKDKYEYVKNPKHYKWFDKEVIDAIELTLTHEQFKGFLMGTSMRYRFRCGSKPGEPLDRDINKAKTYEQYWYDYVKRNTP